MSAAGTATAPGKLFLAGEYAVVEPGRQALLVAVDRTAGATVGLADAADANGRIVSDFYGPQGRTWRLASGGVTSDELESSRDVIFAVIALVDELLRQRGQPRRAYTVTVRSSLASGDGRKYGLGSSAAVGVACLRALDGALGLHLDDAALLKLGMLAALALNRNGSGGDVAASVLGGWLRYASPDRAWIRARRGGTTLDELLAQPWPGLLARPLAEPAAVQLLVGWTGAPASTTTLVAAQRAPVPQALLDASDQAVDALAQALRGEDARAALAALRQARGAVRRIAAARGRDIETPRLRLLCELAEVHGAAAKTSGAGGGDCGIALLPAGLDPEPIHTAWRENGIEPLALRSAPACATARQHTAKIPA